MYLLYHDDEDGVSYYKSEESHKNHLKIKPYGISDKYRQAIDGIYELIQKPKPIKRQLVTMCSKDDKKDFPTDSQLKNYLYYKGTKRCYKAKLN